MTKSSESYYIGDWLVEPLLLRMSKGETVKKLEPQLILEENIEQTEND